MLSSQFTEAASAAQSLWMVERGVYFDRDHESTLQVGQDVSEMQATSVPLRYLDVYYPIRAEKAQIVK